MDCQEKVRDKENEIPAIPRLLNRLEIKGASVSIDAMGTQVDIAEKILSKGGHYLLPVKENQDVVLYEVKDVMRYNESTSVHTETEMKHGRVEPRTVWLWRTDLNGILT